MAKQIKFGSNLRELIQSNGSRGERMRVARALGVTPSALSQYMTGRSNPKLQTLVALSELFRTDLDTLVFGLAERVTLHSDHRPAIRYMQRTVADVRGTIDRQTRLFGVLIDKLADRLKDESRLLAERKISQGGIISDGESLVLEAYSEETWILSMNLDQDLVDVDGEKGEGPFIQVVANNLTKGRKYRFLLSAHFRDWRPVVETYRSLLTTLCEADVSRRCLFRLTNARVVSGCGFYRLSAESLNKEEPILGLRFAEWVHDGWLGYLIAASRTLQADSLMDEEHLANGRTSFERLWRQAKPI